MKFTQPLYFCCECKTVLNSLEDLLFIEEKSTKGFCSKECIEDFYRPITAHFDLLEKKIRNRLGLEHEKIQSEMDESDLVEAVMADPDEVFAVSNQFEEELTYMIKHFETFSAVMICTLYKKEASFILFFSKTHSQSFLEQFRTKSSKLKQDEFSDEDFNFMNLLENKKSKLLADILIKRKEDDISFEDFSLYDSYFEESLHSPDEVFESKDNEGDIFFVYIKSFTNLVGNFFYIIVCLKRLDLETSSEINVFPVLSFPTNDIELYSEFRAGKKIAGVTRN